MLKITEQLFCNHEKTNFSQRDEAPTGELESDWSALPPLAA